MLNTIEDMLMLELASSATGGDLVDIAMGADVEVHPTDFDSLSDEELVLGMVDMLLDGSNRKAED